jgi:hypothetical protein
MGTKVRTGVAWFGRGNSAGNFVKEENCLGLAIKGMFSFDQINDC